MKVVERLLKGEKINDFLLDKVDENKVKFELKSGQVWKNPEGYTIFFAPDGYIEIAKHEAVITDFYEDSVILD